jgi:pilus assembly protein CpaB
MKIFNLIKFKPKKTWLILIIALLVGGVAAFIANSYLSRQLEAIEAKSRGQTIDVVVAKRDLVKGSKLTSENLAVRPIPIEYAHSAAILPAEFDRVENQTIAFSMKSGDAIMWGFLEGKKTPTFSARVEIGHRAITVPVDEINSISGLLEPGDMIDLIVTIDKEGKKTTFPLIQNVPVMATGQRSVDDPKSGERRQYSTVTLDTKADQAKYVVIAREMGRLTALLRNPQDTSPTFDNGVDIALLLGLKANTEKDPTSAGIPIIYGGSKLGKENFSLKKTTNAETETSLPPKGLSSTNGSTKNLASAENSQQR